MILPKPAPANLGQARSRGAILLTVFVAAICGLVYELIAGAMASYLLGDSVTQFSLVIGVFLAAMGLGSFLSKRIHERLLERFIALELAIGLVGGSSALVGFVSFAYTQFYTPILLGQVALVGTLVGMEIPLVLRILDYDSSLRVNVAEVLTADYVGALIAAVLFPFLLVPYVGLVRAGLLTGASNVALAYLLAYRLSGQGSGRRAQQDEQEQRALDSALSPAARRRLMRWSGVALVGMLAATLVAGRLTTWLENQLYQDNVVLARDTRYQRMIVTRWRDDVRLYLNGHLQFSSVDEYRYHESLVHPAMALSAAKQKRVLVLGGGDGLAAREILKHPSTQVVDLVDLDAEVVKLFREHPLMTKLNKGSLRDAKLRYIAKDAMQFLVETKQSYDVILMDLPDPSAAGLGKLYSKPFFRLVGKRLRPGGAFAAQCTSPFRSRLAYWSIVRTIEAARWGPEGQKRFYTAPYHTLIPTFGSWGFMVARSSPFEASALRVSVPTRYLTNKVLPTLFVFPADMDRVEAPISELNNPVVVRLYRDGYHKHLD